MNEKTSLMHLRTTDSRSRQSVAPNPPRAMTSNRPMSSLGSVRVVATANSSKHASMRASSASTLNSRSTNQRDARPVRSTSTGHHPRSNISSVPPRLTVLNTEKRKALSSSTINAAQQEETTTIASSKSNTESPAILPFGNILAEIPSEKENGTRFHVN